MRESFGMLAWLLMAAACGAPDAADTSLELVSQRGLVSAQVQFAQPVKRGDNALLVALHASEGEAAPRLLSVRAVMVAHAHQVGAGAIEATPHGYRASRLNLFMTGRWLVELELELDDQRDRASLPVDVP